MRAIFLAALLSTCLAVPAIADEQDLVAGATVDIIAVFAQASDGTTPVTGITETSVDFYSYLSDTTAAMVLVDDIDAGAGDYLTITEKTIGGGGTGNYILTIDGTYPPLATANIGETLCVVPSGNVNLNSVMTFCGLIRGGNEATTLSDILADTKVFGGNTYAITASTTTSITSPALGAAWDDLSGTVGNKRLLAFPSASENPDQGVCSYEGLMVEITSESPTNQFNWTGALASAPETTCVVVIY